MRACVCGWLTDWRVCMFGCVGVCVCSSLRRRRFCCLFSRERKTSCRLKGVCLETVNVPSKVVRPSLGLAARAPVTGRPPVRRNVPLDVVWYLNFSLLFFSLSFPLFCIFKFPQFGFRPPSVGPSVCVSTMSVPVRVCVSTRRRVIFMNSRVVDV